MSVVLNKEGFLVTVDIEKAFDSVNRLFVIAILKKISFGTEFIEWIKNIIGPKTSKYFKQERGTRQGDPISAYLIIIVHEVVFWIIKETSKVLKFLRRNLSTLFKRMILPFFLKILNLL